MNRSWLLKMKDSISQLLTVQLSNTPQGFKFLMKAHFDLDSLERGQFVNHESIGLPLAMKNQPCFESFVNHCSRETGNFSHLELSPLFTKSRMWYNFSVWISVEFVSEMKMSGKYKLRGLPSWLWKKSSQTAICIHMKYLRLIFI